MNNATIIFYSGQVVMIVFGLFLYFSSERGSKERVLAVFIFIMAAVLQTLWFFPDLMLLGHAADR